MIDYKKQGKKNRASGAAFELKVRKDLEEKGWIVDKWSNNVKLHFNKLFKEKLKSGKEIGIIKHASLIPAKHKFRGMGIPMAMGTGFPDFICFRQEGVSLKHFKYYEVIGVEAKSNGYLDKEEKEKVNWLKSNNIFSKILVAYKTKEKNKIKINYKEV